MAHAAPQTNTAIGVAAAGDFDRIVADLLEAFMKDPVLCWVFPDRRARRRYGGHFFAMQARRLIPTGHAWMTPGGSALWAPAGMWRETPREALRLAARTLPGMWRHGPRVGRGLLGVEGRHPSEPHMYLAAIGVRPEHQRRGLGSALLRPGVARADELTLPAYLESSNPRNVPLYERHGFRVTGQYKLPRGPTMTLMWREPGAPHAARVTGVAEREPGEERP